MRQLSDWKDEVEEIVFPGKISVPYSWTVGSTLSKWYVQLRDDGEIWANRCQSCGRVYVPPKIKCIECYKDMNDWVKLPGTGTVEGRPTGVSPMTKPGPVKLPWYGPVAVPGGVVPWVNG